MNCFLLLLTALLVVPLAAAQSPLNVYGQALQPCSTDGMALTGYTRNGACVNHRNDRGSHHICLDIGIGSSATTATTTTDHYHNFCTVTGQPNWCHSHDMPCHHDPSQHTCRIQYWCVCEWAFASYLQAVGGCDAVPDLVCDAIHQQALTAYQSQMNHRHQPKYAKALACLVQRCGLSQSLLSSGRMDGGSYGL